MDDDFALKTKKIKDYENQKVQVKLDKKEIVRDLSTYQLNSAHHVKLRDRVEDLRNKLRKVQVNVTQRYVHTEAGQWEWTDHKDSSDEEAENDHHWRKYIPSTFRNDIVKWIGEIQLFHPRRERLNSISSETYDDLASCDSSEYRQLAKNSMKTNLSRGRARTLKTKYEMAHNQF